MRDELGSEWHSMELDGPPASWPWKEARYFGTAREALRALMELLRPPRLWVPSYGCQPFFAAVHDQVEIPVYVDVPWDEHSICSDHDAAILVHNPFGARGSGANHQGRWLIEDHTHAPDGIWARSSAADYCLASLRKTLPLADGAVLWSPCGRPLPDAPIGDESEAVRLKWRGMDAKAAWLRGEAVDKGLFRSWLAQGEVLLGGQRGMSPRSLRTLLRLPEVRSVREAHFAALARWSLPSVDPCPSFAVVRCASAEVRNQVRGALVAEGIYPAALWPVPLGSAAERGFSETTFAIPVDLRATDTALERAASVLERWLPSP